MSGNGAATCPEEYIALANKLADEAGKVVSKYFRYHRIENDVVVCFQSGERFSDHQTMLPIWIFKED